MRGAIPELPSSQPIGQLLPGIFLDDPLVQAFSMGLDEALAPVPGVLDSLCSYLDPWLAPDDFVAWLAGWVGLELNEEWPEAHQREGVAHAVEASRDLGTATGIRRYLELVSGGQVEVLDSGGVAISQQPGSPLPGEDRPLVAVRVVLEPGAAVSAAELERALAWAKPAWVGHELEVIAP